MIDYTLSDKLKVQYQTANPFPYIVIDNFLPEFILKKTKEEILKHDTWFSDNIEWTKPYQQKKFYYPGHDTKMDELSMKLPITNLVMDYLNSNEFIVFLEKITGFKKLYRDPILMGGGIHKIKRGGKLSIHKDYNEHPETKKQRRINVLIYLNENWESSWGGNLELWSNDTWKKSVEIEPIFNRVVIFNIENAPHGHPTPLNCPDNIDRYSLALYYFTDNFLEDDLNKYVSFYDEEDLGITKKIDDIFKI